jgi:hypothetical protein
MKDLPEINFSSSSYLDKPLETLAGLAKKNKNWQKQKRCGDLRLRPLP